MKSIFESRQRAEELMQEALNIWRASDQSDFLIGLEKDPVFNVIMNALAYQANDLDNEIAQLKEDILDEFNRMLSTGIAGNAVPATITVQVNASSNIPVLLDETTPFYCADAQATFLPLLKTHAFNIKSYDVERLDGRRWRVGIDLAEPVESLEGMTFAISDQPFHDLRVSIMTDGENEMPVDITAPWESHNMPMTDPFSLDALIYNRTQAVVGGGERGGMSPHQRYCAMDLFARQGYSLYYIGRQDEDVTQVIASSSHIDFCFEFDGLGESFFFNEAQIAFNTVLLANAAVKTATLSKDNPVVKLAGGDEEDFLYLLRPDRDQILASVSVDVRRQNTDRFNRSDLIRLLSNLIGRFQSDYYAFMDSNTKNMEPHILHLIESLKHMQDIASTDSTPGQSVYLQINSQANMSSFNNHSLTIKYLVTKGDSINKKLSQDTKITVPALLDQASCVQIVPPQYGHNAIRSSRDEMSLRRYMMTTNDRLVTPYDIQMFCYNELLLRYNIEKNMVESLTVKHERFDQSSYHSYAIKVTITLAANSFVQRAFNSTIPSIEKCLEKMIQIRTSGIYPIKVKMII